MLLSVPACSADSGYVLLSPGIFDGVEFADPKSLVYYDRSN